MSTTNQTTTEWAREHGQRFAYRVALDNHEPTRAESFGEGWIYDLDDSRGEGIVLANVSELRDARRAVYLIDTGNRVEPYYVAAWHPEGEHLILHPFPTNVNRDGSPRLRADDGRQVDYGSWEIGPRRAYHLKITITGPTTLHFPGFPPIKGVGAPIVEKRA